MFNYVLIEYVYKFWKRCKPRECSRHWQLFWKAFRF